VARTEVYRGERYTIAFALEKSGKCPGAEFFMALPTLDKAKLMALFKIACDLGKMNNPEKFGDLGDGLREFKSHQIRMPFAFARNERGLILITHGFIKKRDKAPPEEIKRARRILDEDQGRPGLEIVRKAKQ
jgi:phage-related protein